MKRLFLIYVLILLSSCDLFQSREPESPDTPRSSYELAVSPEILFKNFKSSFDELNVDNYMRSFVDYVTLNKEYQYIPSAGSTSQYSSLVEWDLDSERKYFNNLIARIEEGGNITLVLTELNKTIGENEATFLFEYNLVIPFVEENLPKSYRGNAEFIINRDNESQWVIVQWADIKTEDFPSWSELKGRQYL